MTNVSLRISREMLLSFPLHTTRLLILFQDPVTEGWGSKPEAYLLLFNLIHYIPPQSFPNPYPIKWNSHQSPWLSLTTKEAKSQGDCLNQIWLVQDLNSGILTAAAHSKSLHHCKLRHSLSNNGVGGGERRCVMFLLYSLHWRTW